MNKKRQNTVKQFTPYLVLLLIICAMLFLYSGTATKVHELKTGEFLKYINPKIAIISCGYKNYYGHPSESVIGNLNILKIPYKRTDQDFTIAYIL